MNSRKRKHSNEQRRASGNARRTARSDARHKGNRVLWVFGAMAALFLTPMMWHLANEALTEIVVYVRPNHECCMRWVAHLRAAGFHVQVVETEDVDAIRRDVRVPEQLAACHTAVTAQTPRYVIEGHVPADAIRKLFAERPAIRGLSVPGMPSGAPGLEGHTVTGYEVHAFLPDGRIMRFPH